ncbi:MAG: hypothetical protein Kow006_14470 [Gammaproteobacteria bacterium]
MSAEITAQRESRHRSLLPLWAMVLIFGLPFIASVTLYLNPDWLPGPTGNRGTLINPPVDTRSWAWITDGGEPFDNSRLAKNWVLVMIADSACSARCEERAYELRQVRRAAGVERARVMRLMVFTEPPTQASRNALQKYYPQLPRIIVGRDHPLHALPGGALGVGAVVIIDPVGQAMMRYTPSQSAKDILKDLKHLLKVSEDWTKERQP